jgi:hypothetical protein
MRFQWQSRQKDILKTTIGNESLHKISNDNGVRLVNFANIKIPQSTVSTISPHHNSHKYTWTSSEGKIHNQIDHILTDIRRLPSVLDV